MWPFDRNKKRPPDQSASSQHWTLVCVTCGKKYVVGEDSILVSDEDAMDSFFLAGGKAILGTQARNPDLAINKGTLSPLERQKALENIQRIKQDLQQGRPRSWRCYQCSDNAYPEQATQLTEQEVPSSGKAASRNSSRDPQVTPRVPVKRIDTVIIVLHNQSIDTMPKQEAATMAAATYRSLNSNVFDAMRKHAPHKAVEYSLRTIRGCSLNDFPVLAARNIKADYRDKSMFVQGRRRDFNAKTSDTFIFTILDRDPKGKAEVILADDSTPLEPDVE